jgi:hypothetical protein
MAWGIAVAILLICAGQRYSDTLAITLESSNGGPKTALDMGQKDLI